MLALWAGAASPVGAAALVTRVVADPLTGVALDGFDPVSYFLGPTPQPGLPDYMHEWGGVTWYFASAANRDVFSRNPQIYAPQFGGHCVTSLSRGFLSDGKPRLYLIRDSRLYLFYSIANRSAFLAAAETAMSRATGRWLVLEGTTVGPGESMAQAVAGASRRSE